MYIARSMITLQGESENDLLARVEASHASRLASDGFRWAMLLRSQDDAANYASVSMWLSQQHAEAWRAVNEAPPPMRGYDVVTARGDMTPAAAVAIVAWQVDPALAARFAGRWNACFHDIEDVWGNRLLQDLDAPSSYAGLHVVKDASQLDLGTLSAPLTDADGLNLRPGGIERFDVLLLSEA